MAQAHNIGIMLVQICRAHRNRLSTALSELGLHVGQEHAIYQLSLHEGVPQSELARSLFIDVSTATKMLLRLERDGVIMRRTDPDDGRVSRVYLTDHGRSLVAPLMVIWAETEAQILAGLSPDDQARLGYLLPQLLRNLTRE